MKPMLAFTYQDRGHRYPDEFHIQPKLNGVRMLYQGGIMQSRDEILWKNGRLQHIKNALSTIPSHLVLDGELYLHGMSLQKINSAASVKANMDNENSSRLEYWVFDMLDLTDPLAPFYERTKLLKQLLQNFKSPIFYCPTIKANRLLAESFYLKAKAQHFEGIMYRLSDKPYGIVQHCSNKQNRWECLLKRKGYLDTEVDVVGVVPGEGKYTNMMGSLTCLIDDNTTTFEVGTGFSDAERARYFDNPPSKIRIHFETLSDSGIPTQPRYECSIE